MLEWSHHGSDGSVVCGLYFIVLMFQMFVQIRFEQLFYKLVSKFYNHNVLERTFNKFKFKTKDVQRLQVFKRADVTR